MTEWQPISTAPKDGTHILIAWCGFDKEKRGPLPPRVVIGAYLPVWHPDNLEWIAVNLPDLDGERGNVASLTNSMLEPFGVGPTHWQPLPSPPEAT